MDTTTWILIYLVGALAGSMLPFMRVYFSHFHHLINLVISACVEIYFPSIEIVNKGIPRHRIAWVSLGV
ncbi:hypothetical protein CN481_20860 [Bacillus sp. AFS006103]|nr:hypothetical protein CN481_20860 [Bacillus sp. AFS006103]